MGSFAEDFEKRKQIKEKLSKGDYSLETSSSTNAFEETVKEAAPPAVKKAASSSGSSGSSGKKSTTVKSTKSTVGDTVKKATSGTKVEKQYIDDPEHENGTPVEDEDDDKKERDEVSVFDDADDVKEDKDGESVSFAPKFSGTASVFSDIAKSAFPGSDDDEKSSAFSAKSKAKSRHESAEEIKKDPSKLYKKKEMDSSFYNDFQIRKAARDTFMPVDRETGETGQDGRSIYESSKDATLGENVPELSLFESEPQLLDDSKQLTEEAEKYVTAGVRLDTVFGGEQIVSREYARKSANNVMYDTVTYTMDDGRKIELVEGSAHTKELDARYLSRYLNEDQIMTYYYLRGRFGKGEAEDYLYNDLLPAAEDTDFYTLNVERNKNFAAEHPVITAAITPFTGMHNMAQEAVNTVKDFMGQETTSRDTSASDAFTGRLQAVRDSDMSAFAKTAAQAGLIMAYNAPEMALRAVPVAGVGLSAVAGALAGRGDKRAQLRSEGNLDAEYAGADIFVAGLIGGLEWSALTKLVSTPVSKLIGNASGFKAAIGDIAKNALGSAGVGVSQQFLDTAMDQFFLQDESAFERTKQYYISQGMDETEAHAKSLVDNYVKPGINAALTGAFIGTAYGLPRSIASGLTPLGAAEIKKSGNVNKVINYGLNTSPESDAYVHAEMLSAKRQNGDKISDAEIERQAQLNTADLERRAALKRFEVLTDDSVPVGDDSAFVRRDAAEGSDSDHGNIRYSSEDIRYRDDSRAFKVNTGFEKAVRDVFGTQGEFDTERIERDIFDFTEESVGSFDRLLNVSDENYNDALVTSYSELIETAARSFGDVYDLFHSADTPRKIAAAALQGFIKDNSLRSASQVIDSADSAFRRRFDTDSGPFVERDDDNVSLWTETSELGKIEYSDGDQDFYDDLFNSDEMLPRMIDASVTDALSGIKPSGDAASEFDIMKRGFVLFAYDLMRGESLSGSDNTMLTSFRHSDTLNDVERNQLISAAESMLGPFLKGTGRTPELIADSVENALWRMSAGSIIKYPSVDEALDVRPSLVEYGEDSGADASADRASAFWTREPESTPDMLKDYDSAFFARDAVEYNDNTDALSSERAKDSVVIPLYGDGLRDPGDYVELTPEELRASVRNYVDGIFDDPELVRRSGEFDVNAFEASKRSYSDIAYKLMSRADAAKIDQPDRISAKLRGELDSKVISDLTKLGDSMFAEFVEEPMEFAPRLAEAAVAGYMNAGAETFQVAEPELTPRQRYSSTTNSAFDADEYAFKNNTAIELSIAELFGGLRPFDREKVDRDIFVFMERGAESFDKLLAVPAGAYDEALRAAYSELIVAASESFSNVTHLYRSDDFPKRIASAAIHAFIKDNHLTDADSVIAAEDSSFRGQKRGGLSRLDEFLNDISDIDLGYIMDSKDVSVRMLYDKMLDSGSADGSYFHSDIDTIYNRLSEKYGKSFFDPDAEKSPEERYAKIAEAAAYFESVGPPRGSTPDVIREADIKLYEMDIEDSFRNGLVKSERDCIALGNFVRESVGSIISSIKLTMDSGEMVDHIVPKFDEYADRVNDVVADITNGKGYSYDEIMDITGALNDMITDLSFMQIRKLQNVVNTIAAAYAADTTAYGRKISKKEAEWAANIGVVLDQAGYDLAYNTGSDAPGVLSQFYSNSMQRNTVSGLSKEFSAQYENKFRHMPKTKAETLLEARDFIDGKKSFKERRAVVNELKKKEMWNELDVAKAALLAESFDNEGRESSANDVYIEMSKKATKAGRALNAYLIMKNLSPKMQFEYAVRSEERRIDSVIANRGDKEQILNERDAAREYDRELSNAYNERRKQAMDDFKLFNDQLRELEEELSKAPPEVREIRKTEEMTLRARMKMTEDYLNSLSLRQFDFISKIDKVKATIEKRRAVLRRNFQRYEESYTRKLAEIHSLQSRLDNDPKILKKFGMDTLELRSMLESKSMELFSEMQDARRYYTEGEKGIDGVIALYNRFYTESDKLKKSASLGFDEDKVYEKYKIDHIPREDIERARTLFVIADSFARKADLIEFMMGLSYERKTACGPHVRKMLEKIGSWGADSPAARRFGLDNNKNDSVDIGMKILSDIAKKQIHGLVMDKIKTKKGAKFNAYISFSHLVNTITWSNNVISTALFSPLENLTNNIGAVIDRVFFSIVTGQRSVGAERPFSGGKAGVDSAMLSAIGTALKVPVSKPSANVEDARIEQRSFKGRVGSMMERSIGYAVGVPDDFFRGIQEERVRKSLEKLGWSREEIHEAAEYEAAFRTFNDESLIGFIMQKFKSVLNVIGIGFEKGTGLKGRLQETPGIGLGDIFIRYPKVSGNILQRTIEYSPLGYMKALYYIGSAVNNRLKNKNRLSKHDQRRIVLTLSRATTGTGIMAVGALLASTGVIVIGSLNDDSYKRDKYEDSKGIGDSVYINWSRLGRIVSGDFDSKLENGDELMDIDMLSIWAPLLRMGAIAYQSYDLKDTIFTWDFLKATSDVPINAVYDLPMMQSASNFMTNWRDTDSFGTASAVFAADTALGFIPGPIRYIGNFIDPYPRNPYKQESPFGAAKDKFLSKLPIMSVRESIPTYVDIFGNNVSYATGNRFVDFYNNVLSSFRLSVYTENEITDEIDRLVDKSSEILPEIPYDNVTGYVNNIKYNVKLENKDYEEFAVFNGQLSYEGLRLMIDSYYYNEMPDDVRIRMLENVSLDANKLARDIWVGQVNELLTEADVNTMISDFLEDVKTRAAYETKMAQALEYITRDDVNIEDALGSYAVVKVPVSEWSEDRVKDELASYDEKIYKLQTGEAWYKDEGGLWHQSKDWSPRTVQTKLEDAMFWRQRIIDGTATYDRFITGKWSELSYDDKEAVLDALEKNIKTMSLPEEAIDHIPEFTLTLDGLRTQVSRERRQAAEEAARAAENGETPAEQESAFTDDYESPDYGDPVQKKSYRNRYYNYGNRYYGNYYGNYGRRYYDGYGGGSNPLAGRRLYASYSSGIGGRSRVYSTSGYSPSSGYSSGSSGGSAFPDPFSEIIFNAFPHIFDKLTGGR